MSSPVLHVPPEGDSAHNWLRVSDNQTAVESEIVRCVHEAISTSLNFGYHSYRGNGWLGFQLTWEFYESLRKSDLFTMYSAKQHTDFPELSSANDHPIGAHNIIVCQLKGFGSVIEVNRKRTYMDCRCRANLALIQPNLNLEEQGQPDLGFGLDLDLVGSAVPRRYLWVMPGFNPATMHLRVLLSMPTGLRDGGCAVEYHQCKLLYDGPFNAYDAAVPAYDPVLSPSFDDAAEIPIIRERDGTNG